jgi:hypothetical protein
MSKPIVHYDRDASMKSTIRVGNSAIVRPLDHTSEWVSNTQLIATSSVVKNNNKTGIFETLNSIYVPINKSKTPETIQ